MKLNVNLASVQRLIRGLVVAPAAFVGAARAGPASVVGVILLGVAAITVASTLLSSSPLSALVGTTRSRATG